MPFCARSTRGAIMGAAIRNAWPSIGFIFFFFWVENVVDCNSQMVSSNQLLGQQSVTHSRNSSCNAIIELLSLRDSLLYPYLLITKSFLRGETSNQYTPHSCFYFLEIGDQSLSRTRTHPQVSHREIASCELSRPFRFRQPIHHTIPIPWPDGVGSEHGLRELPLQDEPSMSEHISQSFALEPFEVAF